MTFGDHASPVMPDALDSAEAGAEVNSTGTPTVTPDGAFEVLADPQRRAVLATLRERRGEPVSVEALIDAVISCDAGESDPEKRRRIAASLATVHLPKLEDRGLVAFDDEHRTVQYLNSPLVERLLERVEED